MGACGRVWGHVAEVVAGCGGMWQGLGYLVGGQAYGMDGDMWWGWGHVVGCGGMWQGVGACGRGGGRVWGHVAGGGVCGRGSGLCHGWGYVTGVGTCGRVWGHVAGCGGMCHNLPHAPTLPPHLC